MPIATEDEVEFSNGVVARLAVDVLGVMIPSPPRACVVDNVGVTVAAAIVEGDPTTTPPAVAVC